MERKDNIYRGLCCMVLMFFTGTFLMADLLRSRQTEASVPGLPEPAMLLKSQGEYSLPVLRGVKINYDNPLNLDFIIDSADKGNVDRAEIRCLINYFYATLAVSNESLWVNLSPYEEERVLDDTLEQTELGRDLLAQDYILKQFAGSLTHPDTELGKKYWYEINNSSSVTHNFDTEGFSKIWIMPESAKINEANGMAWVSEASLTAQTEEDYLAMKKNVVGEGASRPEGAETAPLQTILPTVINEINNGKNFARLRQIYYSMLLGMWFKKRLRESFFANIIEQKNMNGLNLVEEGVKEKIWGQYCRSFEKGIYDVIRRCGSRDHSEKTGRRKRFFSGGFDVISSAVTGSDGQLREDIIDTSVLDKAASTGQMYKVGTNLVSSSVDKVPDAPFTYQLLEGIHKLQMLYGRLNKEDILKKMLGTVGDEDTGRLVIIEAERTDGKKEYLVMGSDADYLIGIIVGPGSDNSFYYMEDEKHFMGDDSLSDRQTILEVLKQLMSGDHDCFIKSDRNTLSLVETVREVVEKTYFQNDVIVSSSVDKRVDSMSAAVYPELSSPEQLFIQGDNVLFISSDRPERRFVTMAGKFFTDTNIKQIIMPGSDRDGDKHEQFRLVRDFDTGVCTFYYAGKKVLDFLITAPQKDESDGPSAASAIAGSTVIARDGGISMQETGETLVIDKSSSALGKMFADIDYDFKDGIKYNILSVDPVTPEAVLAFVRG